ncbi:protein geranylgeranyltransferase type II [Talaromyces islandicus]|uniref:protein geranylgeranyltransferase type II n=1 Tax=Talaromyces islandicus TaxID=28573 RepID=A0A0U1M6N6_TALIS|nr:protein geranylgeranyltransferase type II [Talaromyces islandicus]
MRRSGLRLSAWTLNSGHWMLGNARVTPGTPFVWQCSVDVDVDGPVRKSVNALQVFASGGKALVPPLLDLVYLDARSILDSFTPSLQLNRPSSQPSLPGVPNWIMSLVSGPGRGGGGSGSRAEFCTDKHVAYIKSLDTRRDELEYWYTEHLRMNGVYWGLHALHLMDHPETLPRQETIDFILSCQTDNGGFGAAPGHDAHMLYTVSAVQVLVIIDAVDELDKAGRDGKQKVVSFIASLQDRQSGVFKGDEWGETDTRFSYGALLALSLLGKLDEIDLDKVVSYIQQCENLDGGYGVRPGAESHSGQILTCVAALAIANRLDLIDTDRLGTWLSERQLESGGLNGRPEKLEDVCYSWWVAASLDIIGRLHWIDRQKLEDFILRCQDTEEGGIADQPGNMVDVFHTHFGTAGLSLLHYPGLKEIDPVYCMPKETIKKWFGSICNKKPRFSDQSHLLTHIASKAHLANYFKLQVKSRHDAEAFQELTDYDRWYQNYGLAKLLSDRMAMASSTTRKRRSARLVEASANAKIELINDEAPGLLLARADAVEDRQSQWLSFEDNIDPRLSGLRPFTSDENVGDLTSTVASTLSGSSEHPFIKTEPDSLNNWKEIREDIPNETRSSKRVSMLKKGHRASKSAILPVPTPLPCIPSQADSKSTAVEPKTDEMTRLKGIQWPGMDLFDAATEPMKRQRNQKKDERTFKAMEEASTATEPNEMVFSPSGTLRREREITGYVEDDDPLPGEWRISKPRRDRRDTRDRRDYQTNEKKSDTNKCAGRQEKRVALAASDPNRTVLGSRVMKKGHRPKRQMSEERGTGSRVPTSVVLNKQNLHHAHGHTTLTIEENDELHLSMEAVGQSRSPPLQVFKDDSPPVEVPESNHFISSLIDEAMSHSESFEMPYLTQASDVISGLLASNDHEHFSTSFQQPSLQQTHNYSHDHENFTGVASRSIEGMFLVDASGGPPYRGSYDPIIGGNVLHYRWNWHESELDRDYSTSDNHTLGVGLSSSRPASAGSTIYEDEVENKSRLWLDGCCT